MDGWMETWKGMHGMASLEEGGTVLPACLSSSVCFLPMPACHLLLGALRPNFANENCIIPFHPPHPHILFTHLSIFGRYAFKQTEGEAMPSDIPPAFFLPAPARQTVTDPIPLIHLLFPLSIPPLPCPFCTVLPLCPCLPSLPSLPIPSYWPALDRHTFGDRLFAFH